MRALAFLWVLAVGLITSQASLAGEVRTLFLTLDAVPYSFVEQLERSGAAPELFEELGSPRVLISTFPSTTTIALTAAFEPLGLEASPGYEARYFDWNRKKVRGGGIFSYFRIEFPWREFFEWSKKGVARSAVASLRPVKASEQRVQRAVNAFLDSTSPNYFAYIETTDTAAHLRGPDSLVETFRLLGLAIRDARKRSTGDFRVAVFSDHGIAGGQALENVLPDLRQALRVHGIKEAKKLGSSGRVALTPYGLVSSFEAYADPLIAPRLAEVLSSVEGVALCAYQAGNHVGVVAADGAATIEQAEGDWAYNVRSGDPLRYGEFVQNMRLETGSSAARSWFSDREWFKATRQAEYPDALSRLYGAFDLVKNPATVICSVEPGFMYGARGTQRAARITGGPLRWTHGALFREASNGFLLTDIPVDGCCESIRISDALLPLVSLAAREETSVFQQASGNR